MSVANFCAEAKPRRRQSQRQSSSLSRMTEGEKSSFSLVFVRNKEHAQIVSFKLKVCLTLFSASAAYYKYARKEKLFAFRIYWLIILMELKDPETPKKSCNVD